jgi:hypothetical protein
LATVISARSEAYARKIAMARASAPVPENGGDEAGKVDLKSLSIFVPAMRPNRFARAHPFID